MKSNAIMTRKMGEFDVLQRTSDGYFNGNELLRQWNAIEGNKRRDMSEFLSLNNTKEFIKTLEDDLNTLSAKAEQVDIQQVIKVVKIRNGKGRPEEQKWMHPYLFIKLSMFINPKFELSVIKFIYDKLIENRHLAGDNYNKLTAQLVKFKDIDYAQVAQALNYIVFNKHYKGIRNDATPHSLQELHELEDKLAFSIDMGLVTSYDHLITVMRKMYSDKYPKPF